MKNKFSTSLLAGIGFFSLILMAAPDTHAISLRPVREEISLPPGQSTEGEFTVINDSEKDFMAQPIITVFYGTNEEGVPQYPTEETDQTKAIRSWLDIPIEPVSVTAKGSAVVKYKLNIPQNAEPGGRYISVAFQPIKEESEAVTINVRVASLLLINVEGDVKRSGSLSDFRLVEAKYSDQPILFDLKIDNTGNTHLKPKGTVEIIDKKTNQPLKQVANYVDPVTGEMIVADKVPVNIVGGNILPGSPRKFDAKWNQNIKGGEYKAILNLAYEGLETPITQEIDFNLSDQVSIGNLQMTPQENGATFSFEVKNQGNVNEMLSGGISITNNFGYKVAEVSLPSTEKPEYLAPGESKKIDLPWSIEGGLPKGRYTARLVLNYGFDHQNSATQEISFGKVDHTITYLASALIAVILLLIISVLRRRRKMKPNMDI